ncbi:MAG: hypothetical protein JSV64_07255 [Candidatus Bathyarchaeota archaeon]|nr:MAG: hypothetical protein JSV64_07255 [Candidatus Bathyarchaeota archaeon]
MKAKIAVVTVSGKAYYLLVNELKRKNAHFLSLTPKEKIPVDIKVVLTTASERSQVMHGNVLEYDEGTDPSEIVDQAVRMVAGKKAYGRLVVGVDPGQNIGVAIIGDGAVIKTDDCTNLQLAVDAITHAIRSIPADNITLKIGDGVPLYAEELLHNLLPFLPENVIIERVREDMTSRSRGEKPQRRAKSNARSAIRIGQRQGTVLSRRTPNDQGIKR